MSRAPKLEKEDGEIDWSKGAGDIRNLIRGTNPFPGAFTRWGDKLLKVHRATVDTGQGEAGTVINADGKRGLIVGTGEGALALDEVQPAGKKRMCGADFVRGYRIEVGEKFG